MLDDKVMFMAIFECRAFKLITKIRNERITTHNILFSSPNGFKINTYNNLKCIERDLGVYNFI